MLLFSCFIHVLVFFLQSHKYSGKLGAISALEATPGGVFVALMSRYLDVLHPTMPPRSMLEEPISKDQSGIYVSVSCFFFQKMVE